MGEMVEDFTNAMGKPDPAAPNGLHFSSVFFSRVWELNAERLSDGLEPLKACLDAWSFLVPANSDRLIVGRNAYLPQNLIPSFLDDTLYREWLTKSRLALDLELALAIKVPLTLGGKMELDNFSVEDIVDYYQSTGKIYAKAFKAKGSR